MAKDDNGIILLVFLSALGVTIGFITAVFDMVGAFIDSKPVQLLITSTIMLVISLFFYRLTEGKFPWRRKR